MNNKIIAYYDIRMGELNTLRKYTDHACKLSYILTRPDRGMSMWRVYLRGEIPSHKWVPVYRTANHIMNTLFLEGGIKVTFHTDDKCQALFQFDNITRKEEELLNKLQQSEEDCISIES